MCTVVADRAEVARGYCQSGSRIGNGQIESWVGVNNIIEDVSEHFRGDFQAKHQLVIN
jgi:hypothetical protein